MGRPVRPTRQQLAHPRARSPPRHLPVAIARRARVAACPARSPLHSRELPRHAAAAARRPSRGARSPPGSSSPRSRDLPRHATDAARRICLRSRGMCTYTQSRTHVHARMASWTRTDEPWARMA